MRSFGKSIGDNDGDSSFVKLIHLFYSMKSMKLPRANPREDRNLYDSSSGR
jgi:hypothetical protein